MTGRKTRKRLVADEYGLEITTSQILSLASPISFLEDEYIKSVSIRVKYFQEEDTEPVEVGWVTGQLILAGLAGEDGFSYTEVCNEASADLEVVARELEDWEPSVDDEDLLLCIHEMELDPKHDSPELRKALFLQATRCVAGNLRIVCTYGDTFGLRWDESIPDDWASRMPPGTTFLADSGVVVWDRQEPALALTIESDSTKPSVIHDPLGRCLFDMN